jgi:hypothetical protein
MLRAAAIVLLAAGASMAQAPGCSDAFAGPDLDPAWTFLDADGEDGGSARIAAGKLELAGKGSDAYNAVNEFVGVRRADLAGDFDVSVKIESQTNTNGWAQAGILAATDAAAPAKGGYVVADVTPANGFHLFYDASGTQGTLDKHADAGVSAYPVWIRLARAGAKFSAWYKTSAAGAWVSIAQDITAQGTSGPSQIALMSLSHNDAQEGKTVFDDFTCQGATTGFALSGRSRADEGSRGNRLSGIRAPWGPVRLYAFPGGPARSPGDAAGRTFRFYDIRR